MSKRNENQIYGALGEFIINDEETLFNEEQLKLVKQHKFKLKQLFKKSKREVRFFKIRLAILKSPSYILYFLSTLCGFIALPFQLICSKLDSIGVFNCF